ncbi:hypothetical protein TeGR_g12480, partial [Tetraparma gracilis]
MNMAYVALTIYAFWADGKQKDNAITPEEDDAAPRHTGVMEWERHVGMIKSFGSSKQAKEQMTSELAMLSSKVTANAEKELLDLAKRGDLDLLNAKLEEHDQFITRMKTDVHHFRDQGDLHVNEDISYLPTSASDIYRGSKLNERWLEFLCGKERWKEAIEWLEDLSDDEMRREMTPGKKAAGVKAAHKAAGLKATVKPHPLQLACGAKKDEDAQILVSLLVDKAIALKLSCPAEHQQWFFTLCKAGRCSDAAAWLEAVEGTESVREELTYVDPTENQSGKTLGNKTALNFVCETMAATKTRTGKVADDEIALVRLMLK